MPTKLSAEDQETLMRWPYEYKIPIFPADPYNKEIHYNGWQELDFNKVDFRKEMVDGKYDNGAAARTGQTLNEGVYSIALDFDHPDAVIAWFGSWENVVVHSKKSLIEWHKNEGKIHVILFANEPIPNKKIYIGKNRALLEIRCEKQALFVSPSLHKDGNKYEPLGTTDIITLQSNSGLLQLKAKIDSFSAKYMSDEDKERFNTWLDLDSTTFGIGDGRHDVTKFKICSYFWKYSGEWLNPSDDERFQRAWKWHLKHCIPPRTRQHFDEICKWVIDNHRVKRDREHEILRAERGAARRQQASQNYSQHNDNKKAILAGIYDEIIRSLLDADIWTMVSENPAKFIIARRKACHICRASITYSDSGDKQAQKKAHLNYGSILIRLFPKTITLHESPLKFLEMSERYTIVFENHDRHEVIISGTIEGIISRLKEMPGYIVSSYGIAEALNAIIGAFKDDGLLHIDKTVEFEGYYYADGDGDGDVQISKINLDEKHPRRTKEEVIECIEYLEKGVKFQIWEYNKQTIDRRDLLASAIKWTISAPFNFVMKQLKCPKPFLRGFDMSGERDGGKSGLSEEMLNMHGNPTNEQDADSIYSKSAGSANTEAKFAKAISLTTYPIELSEFSRVETYGRREDLVEICKTSVDGLITRRGKKESRTDAPFPSLSPMIINGNAIFTYKGELIKRLHIAKFSEEDRHDRSPSVPFNKFQKDNKHLLKTLGDWSIRYILDNRQDLLFSRKYSPYEVADISLKVFYKFGD